MPTVTRHRRNPVWLLTVLAVAACTAPPQHTNAPRPDAPTASATGAGREPMAVAPPPLDEGAGETLAGRHRTARGGAHFAYAGGPRGKALIVAVSCRGAGEVTVDLPALGAYFRHACSSGEPAVIYNQFALAAAHRPGTVSVTAPSTVEWAVTVGRGEQPVEAREPIGPTTEGS